MIGDFGENWGISEKFGENWGFWGIIGEKKGYGKQENMLN
jgi:hypothetical protein